MRQLLIVLLIIFAVGTSLCQTGWSEQVAATGQPLGFVKAVDMNVGWTVGKYGGPTMRTVNGGASWEMVTTPTVTGNIWGIEAIDSNTAMITSAPDLGGNTAIWRTTNGGKNWQQVYSLVASGAFLNGFKMVNANIGYALGDPIGGSFLLLKTTDRGATWNPMGSGPLQVEGELGVVTNFAVSGEDKFWFCSTRGSYRSTDAGGTWSFHFTGYGGFVSIWFVDALRGVMTNGNAGVWTEDGGVTWTGIVLPGRDTGESDVSGFGGDFYLARGKTIYRSTNGGKNWVSVFSFSSEGTFWTLDFAQVGGGVRGWAVTWAGPIVTYVEFPSAVSEDQASNSPMHHSLFQNYPNPFNPSTTINYDLPGSSYVTLKVYNMLGQPIVDLVACDQDAGNHQVQFDATNLPSGTYFYTLRAGGYRETKKLLLCK